MQNPQCYFVLLYLSFYILGFIFVIVFSLSLSSLPLSPNKGKRGMCNLFVCLCLLCLCLCLCLLTNGYPEQIGEIDVKERREGATHKDESSLKLPFASLSRSSLMEREILNLIWKCCQKESNQNLCLKHSLV